MEDISDLFNESSGTTHIYDELAPLYDFIYRHHYDYDRQLDAITDAVPDGTDSVIEGACGTGRLTKRLFEEYQTVLGFDLNEPMLRIARQNHPRVTYMKGNMLDLDINDQYDCYCIMGNALVHLTGDGDFSVFASEAEKILSDDGVLLFDYMPQSKLENGYHGYDEFENESYLVKRNTITTRDSEDLSYMSFAFEVNDKESGDSATIGETMQARFYRPDRVREDLLDAGFSDITQLKMDSDDSSIKDRFVVAKL